jgi:hypothetical protein
VRGIRAQPWVEEDLLDHLGFEEYTPFMAYLRKHVEETERVIEERRLTGRQW